MLLSTFAVYAAIQFGDGLPASGGPVTGPDDLTSAFDAPAGVDVKQWADSSRVCNPTAIDIDRRNRMWIAEAANYRKWNGRNPGFARPGGDRIVILEDGDGDAEADTLKVFVQDPDLVAPLGLTVLGTRVVVACSPHVLVYWDSDLDDVPERREIFLTGFGGFDHDHGVHSIVPGPDGQWYIAVGNAGPHLVRDKSGFDLRSGSLYRDGGPELADNKPGLVSSDGRVWTGGLILRVAQNGSELAVVAHNFRNEYEVALDSFGDMYTADNDDGTQGCRTTWVMEGGNYGYFSPDGSRFWQADRRPGQSVIDAHWHQADPGVVPMGTINGAGGPTGVAVYESSFLGFALEGTVLNADAGASVVYAHRPVKSGAGFALEQSVLLAPKAGAKDASWFRPSDVCVSPDGTIYVADWWDPGVGGHGMADREGHGRILRLVPRGPWVYPAEIDLNSVKGRASALESPSPSIRAQAQHAFRTRGRSHAAELEKLAASANPRLRARALFLLAKTDEKALVAKAAENDVDERVRVAALRALRAANALEPALWSKLAIDRSPAVRRELAIALRDEPFERCGATLVVLARAYDGNDRFYLEALGIGADRKEAALFADLLAAEPERDPARWSPRFARLAWRLHPSSAVPLFAARAHAPDVTLDERALACDALAFVHTREAAEALLDLALRGPEDVRAHAAWWTRHRGTYEWRQFGLASQIAGGDLGDATLAWSSGVIKKGRVELDVPLRGSKRLWLVATEGREGQSCDWSDWIAPKLVGPKSELRLAAVPWARAEAAWGVVNRGLNCEGGPLSIDGKVFEDGIGTHAHSVITFDVPAGFERLVAGAGIDDGGGKQPGNRADVEFQVWIDPKVDRARQRELEKALVDPAAQDDAIAASADALAKDRDGGLALLRLAQRGQLTPKARAAVAALIFANPDPALRALASQHFERKVDGGVALPPIPKLAQVEGSAARGMGLFFGAKSTCSTCHAFHGRGGDVGPDLTRITAKYDTAGILDAILNPSRAIELGYETWLVETQDEIVYTGFVLADAETVVLKDTSGKRHALDKSEIASRTKLTVSSMPDNVGLGLSAQELADLVAFLRSDPTKSGKRLAPVQLFDGKSMAGWTFHLSDASKRMEDVWSVKDGVLVCSGNPAGYVRTEREYTSFVLELEWRFDAAKGPGNSGVLMRRTGPDKVWPKSIEAQLMSRNAGDIWNIDEFPMVTDVARTSGRHTGKALPSNEKPLGEWNRYKITLDGSELTLEVNGEVQNRASFCEEVPGHICLQSEGAHIEFRNVVLTPIER